MTFVSSPIERATAITDALVALVALALALRLLSVRTTDTWKKGLWAVAFGLVAVAGALGVVEHGAQLPAVIHDSVVDALNIALGGTIALFVAGAVHDRWGNLVARRSLPLFLLAAGGFFVVTLAVPGTFRVFIAYEAIAMLFALAVYATLAVSRTRGALGMAAGVLVTMVAAIIQVTPLSVRVVWQLDHNSLFHLVQIIGMVLLFGGLRASLEPTSSFAILGFFRARPVHAGDPN